MARRLTPPASLLAALLALALGAAACGGEETPEPADAQPQVEAAGLQPVLTNARDRVYEALQPGEADQEHLERSRDEVRAAADEVEGADVPEELEGSRDTLSGALREFADRLEGAASSVAADPSGTIEQPALDRLTRRTVQAIEGALQDFRDEGYEVGTL